MTATRKIPRTREQILFLHDVDEHARNGETATSTAAKLGLTRNQLYNHLDRCGFRYAEDGHGNRFLVDAVYEDLFADLEKADAFEEITL